MPQRSVLRRWPLFPVFVSWIASVDAIHPIVNVRRPGVFHHRKGIHRVIHRCVSITVAISGLKWVWLGITFVLTVPNARSPIKLDKANRSARPVPLSGEYCG